jgi:hypothetical protein
MRAHLAALQLQQELEEISEVNELEEDKDSFEEDNNPKLSPRQPTLRYDSDQIV